MKSLERPRLTPSSVAKDYFRKELATHSRTGSKVVVFTHDSCYGHRFSRPRSTKATLASIVERPERIHATLLGASTAYVRLGDRHKDGKYGPHPDQDPETISGPPFTIRKSTRSIPLNHPAVTSVHGTKWMDGLQIMCDTAEANLAMGRKELSRPVSHTKDAKGNVLPALHSGDLYLSAESLAALQGCLGGVCDAVDTIFQSETAQRAFVCIRPPGHHCASDMPSGFCWLNNVHVGISYAAMNYGLTHAAIIDFDLHHGDGSQTITWDHNRTVNTMQNPKSAPAHKKIPIGYYSMHDINSYPCEYGDEEKVRNASTCLHTAHGQSIWNVHLEPWRSHVDFWHLYHSKYSVLLEKAQSFLLHHSDQIRQSGGLPKAAIFLSSGFDASEWESEFMQRHEVNVPTDFYAKFTADVVELSTQAGLGVDGRVISVLEGGYSDRALASGVLSHLCGLTHNIEQVAEPKIEHGLIGPVPEAVTPEMMTYDPDWWSVEHLEFLEAMVSGNLPQPPTKAKDKPLSSYTSPTQASTAKMTEVAKERKSLSAQLDARLQLENAPPEPPPEVDWVTAAYELSRLLIPDDRQTLSCTHEELNVENSRARRDRQSLVSAVLSDGVEEKMQLRDRKPKQTNLSTSQSKTATRTTNRRTTIAAASELPDPLALEPSRLRRRSSAASSVLAGFHDLKLEDGANENNIRSSSRIDSTAVSKPQAPLPVKKTRVPAVKKPTSASSSPRKPKAVADTSARLGTVSETKVSNSAGASKPEQSTDSVPNKATQDGMDDLTNGMKKISIKLKMPTEEQHKSNQRLAEEPSKAKARVARKPPVARTVNAKTKISAGSKAAASNHSTSGPQRQPEPENTPVTAPSTGDVNTNEAVTISTSVTAPTSISDIQTDDAHDHDLSSRAPFEGVIGTKSDPSEIVRTIPAIISPSETAPQVPTPELVSKDNATQQISSLPSLVEPASGDANNTISYPTISLINESTTSSQAELAESKENGSSTSIWDLPATPQKSAD